MPTKHKRKRNDDASNYNLPPTTKARPLPVIEPTRDFLEPRKKQKVDGGKRSKKNADDTPKSFARLMAWHLQGRKLGSGLDNGDASKKNKRKQKVQNKKQDLKPEEALGSDPQSQVTVKEGPKIQPGETLAQFSVRVDQTLPLSSLPETGGTANAQLPEDLRAKEKAGKKLTKHNKRLARMQSEWRNTEAKLRAREEEEAEENEEKLEEEKLLWDGIKIGKKRKKGAKAADDDPWKELEKKRRESKQKNIRDVVEAPPTLTGVKNMFKEKAERRIPLPTITTGKTYNGRKARSKDELGEVRRVAILEAERRKSSSRPNIAV